MNSLLQLALFLVVSPAIADYQAGLDAYRAGDFTAAMSEWKEAVSEQPEGENLAVYRESLYAIAMLYWQGEGVEQDFGLSAVWLKQAADINHPGAQAKLGYLYTMGEGVPRNFQVAGKWLRLAAEQGDPDAQYNLAILEKEGLASSPGPDVQVNPVPGQDAGEAWILQQNPDRYTIQVIALSSPDKLHDFIASHPDWSPFALYRQTRYEQPIWVMVQGNYANLEAAREAVKAFPGDMHRRDGLWIRKFGMVQRLIE